jgi:hypothetical protein
MFSFSGGKCMVYRGRPEPNPWNSRRQVLVDAETGQVPLSLIPQPSGNLLDVHQRHIPDPALDANVRPVQSTSLGGLYD